MTPELLLDNLDKGRIMTPELIDAILNKNGVHNETQRGVMVGILARELQKIRDIERELLHLQNSDAVLRTEYEKKHEINQKRREALMNICPHYSQRVYTPADDSPYCLCLICGKSI